MRAIRVVTQEAPLYVEKCFIHGYCGEKSPGIDILTFKTLFDQIVPIIPYSSCPNQKVCLEMLRNGSADVLAVGKPTELAVTDSVDAGCPHSVDHVSIAFRKNQVRGGFERSAILGVLSTETLCCYAGITAVALLLVWLFRKYDVVSPASTVLVSFWFTTGIMRFTYSSLLALVLHLPVKPTWLKPFSSQEQLVNMSQRK